MSISHPLPAAPFPNRSSRLTLCLVTAAGEAIHDGHRLRALPAREVRTLISAPGRRRTRWPGTSRRLDLDEPEVRRLPARFRQSVLSGRDAAFGDPIPAGVLIKLASVHAAATAATVPGCAWAFDAAHIERRPASNTSIPTPTLDSSATASRRGQPTHHGLAGRVLRRPRSCVSRCPRRPRAAPHARPWRHRPAASSRGRAAYLRLGLTRPRPARSRPRPSFDQVRRRGRAQRCGLPGCQRGSMRRRSAAVWRAGR